MHEKELFMLAIRLSSDVEARLDALAKSTGRTKSFYAREAIMEHLEDLEDFYLAAERIKSGTKGIPLDEVEQRLGLAN
jgi:RHH-type transcriptional regulator, rel operon repressor / antitoxin RelB